MALSRVGLQLKSSLGAGFHTRVLEVDWVEDWDHPRARLLQSFRVLPDQEATPELPLMHKGYFDAHLHAIWAGLKSQQVDLSGCPSARELLRLAESAKKGSTGWIQAHGWDESRMGLSLEALIREVEPKLKSLPPALLLRNCGHSAFVSPALIQELGLKIQPGFVRDRDLWMIYDHLPPASPQELERAFVQSQQKLLEQGVTALGEMSLNDSTSTALLGLARSGLLALDVQGVLEAGQALSLEHAGPQKELATRESRLLGRAAQISIRHWKKFLDGSFGSRTAALTQPYQDAESHGDLLCSLPTLLEEAHGALRQGFCLSFHAIGDAALDQILELGERLAPVLESRRRFDHEAGALPTLHRIEHAQLIRDDQLERLRRQKFWALCLQPHHCVADQSFSDLRLGRKRRRQWAYRAGSLLKAEVPLALSSDAPIDTWSPDKVIRAACLSLESSERLSFEEAIWAYTTGPRLSLGLSPGLIRPGEMVFVSDPKNIL